MHIEVRLPAAADTVFDAWVLPQVMQRWLFVGPSNRILEVTSDERAGGKFYVRGTLNLTETGAGPANAAEVWRSMLSGLQRTLVGKPAIGGNRA